MYYNLNLAGKNRCVCLVALQFIHNPYVKLTNVIHISILTEKKFPYVIHSYDIWGGAKNLGNKLIEVIFLR